METVKFNGKDYECRRYSLKELEDLFNGYVVALGEARFENMNLASGILVGVFNIEQKVSMRKKYLLEGKKYTLWDLSPEPVFASYLEIKEDLQQLIYYSGVYLKR